MKCYKFVLSKWIDCPDCLADAVATVRAWVKKNDYRPVKIYLQDDVYIYATDKDVIHMVITNHDWDDLPKVLSNAPDLIDYFLDVIVDRTDYDCDCDCDYCVEDDFYDYIVG